MVSGVKFLWKNTSRLKLWLFSCHTNSEGKYCTYMFDNCKIFVCHYWIVIMGTAVILTLWNKFSHCIFFNHYSLCLPVVHSTIWWDRQEATSHTLWHYIQSRVSSSIYPRINLLLLNLVLFSLQLTSTNKV